MNRTITAMIFAGAAAFGMQAVADDTSSGTPGTPAHNMTAQQKQFMKDCMTKAKASNNGTSEKDMHKSCRDQLKANAGGDQQNQPVTPAH
jgi:hypothetical protein